LVFGLLAEIIRRKALFVLQFGLTFMWYELGIGIQGCESIHL